MNHAQPLTQLENQITAVLSVPNIDPHFAQSLERRLTQQTLPTNQVKTLPRWSFATIAVALLLTIFLVAGPKNVLAILQDWFSFIPGIGYFEGDLYQLEQPVTLQQDQLNLEVYQAYRDQNHTWVELHLTATQPQAPTLTDLSEHCSFTSFLLLDPNTHLSSEWISAKSDPTNLWLTISFPAFPVQTKQADLVLDCIQPTKPDQKSWIFNLRFKPLSSDATLQTYPVFVPTQQPTPTAAPTSEPTQESLTPQLSPDLIADLEFTVDSFTELEDGYQFQGHLISPSQLDLTFTETDIQITDATGAILPTQLVHLPYGINNQPGQQPWALKVPTKDFTTPLTFTLKKVSITQTDPTLKDNPILIDLGENPTVDQTWQLDQTITVAGTQIQLNTLHLVQLTPQLFLLEFDLTYPDQTITDLTLADANPIEPQNGSGGGGGGGGGGANPNEVLSRETIDYASIPTGQRIIYIEAYQQSVEGNWTFTVSLP